MQDQGTPTPQQVDGDPAGYAQVIRRQFLEAPQFRSPAELAAKFHEALLGRGAPTLSSQQQQARYNDLANLSEVRVFTKAAGAELARTYLVLEGLSLKFAAQIARIDLAASQGQAAARDLDRAAKLLDLVLRCTREGRLTLGASNAMSQDMRAYGFAGATVDEGSHSVE